MTQRNELWSVNILPTAGFSGTPSQGHLRVQLSSNSQPSTETSLAEPIPSLAIHHAASEPAPSRCATTKENTPKEIMTYNKEGKSDQAFSGARFSFTGLAELFFSFSIIVFVVRNALEIPRIERVRSSGGSCLLFRRKGGSLLYLFLEDGRKRGRGGNCEIEDRRILKVA